MDVRQRHEADSSLGRKEPGPGPPPCPVPQFTPFTHRRDPPPEPDGAGGSGLCRAQRWMCREMGGGETKGDERAALLGVGTQKALRVVPPPRPLSLGDRLRPWGMCSCLCRGLAPGPPLGPVPEAGTEHPIPQPLGVSRAPLSPQAAPGTAGRRALPAGYH